MLSFDPEAIARACLASQLVEMVDLDPSAVQEICESDESDDIPTPGDDEEEGEEHWDRVYAAISDLADRVRAHFDIQE